MLIAALIDEGFGIHAGSGYMTGQVQADVTISRARGLMMKSLPTKMQLAIRHKRRYAKALKNECDARSSSALWF